MKAVILDTETTGIDEPGLLEAAYLSFDSPRHAAQNKAAGGFSSRFNPGKPIQFGAMATHHILPEDIEHEPAPDVFTLPDDCEYIVGHNCDFDWKVIGEPKVKRICTLAFCRKLWPDCDSHSLGAMLYRLEGSAARDGLRNAHSAMADVVVCRVILGHILDEIGSPDTWEDVWRECEKARIPECMPFGKHKGQRIADVPADYIQWLRRQPDIDPYLMKALKAHA